jgi:hypothetical protein
VTAAGPAADHLATRYDEPDGVPVPPAELSSGHDPAVRVTDGFVRGDRKLGRCRTSPAAVGVKVGFAGPLRITLDLVLDDTSVAWWAGHAGVPAAAEQAGRPRLLLIHAQRRFRRAAVLRPEPGRRAARAAPSFELAAAEIPADGLVLLELWGYREWPAAATGGCPRDLAPHGAVGVAIAGLSISPTGPSCAAEPNVVATDGGLLVVDPAGDGPIRVTLAATGSPSRGAGARGPCIVRHAAGRLRRAFWRAGPRVRATDLIDGGAVPVRSRTNGVRHEIGIPASSHPVLLTFAAAESTRVIHVEPGFSEKSRR